LKSIAFRIFSEELDIKENIVHIKKLYSKYNNQIYISTFLVIKRVIEGYYPYKEIYIIKYKIINI